MRSHGTARACYRGLRPKTGSCEACRKANAIIQRPTKARYYASAKGMLRMARHTAMRRLG